MKMGTNEKKILNYLKLTKIYKSHAELYDLTQEQLDKINSSVLLKNKCLKKELTKNTKKVSKKTFIIPVTDGAVTGYLFENENRDDPGCLAPLVIFFHGGGWIFGNIELYSFYCSRLSSQTGARILLVDYRLAPRFKFPTAIEDCYATLEWAFTGTRYWRVDPDRIYLIGDGAGGNLAAEVSRLARDRKGPKIAGQVLLYPLTDARMRTNSFEKYSSTISITNTEVAYYISQYMNEPKDILDPLFSPLLAKDHSRLPNTLIFGAEEDPLHDDGLLYSDALASADTTVRYMEVPGTYHGYAIIPKVKGSEETGVAIAQFISGKSLSSIKLTTKKELIRINRIEQKSNKMKKKSSYEIVK
ncbi:MAG: alpha/beta hydrolase [Spirochaetaceae bacterium]|nr:alpha/beta hydrolase [Spirochaetaceae bacterium]